eukprot:CAMPEP_0173297192 /NCGR_PEP_ID=MMETSP1143-20121109/15379_1 /TAXON_ID=483371 /ORGANISM="non described non described, Strain CCMP2298" /LENGTH=65 /DNA_ID=CAMNT_0014237127 /DNA_START=336 /DNA_END=533 /DNA_ORIENTATION=+
MRLKHVQLGRALREGKGFSPEDAEVLTERSMSGASSGSVCPSILAPQPFVTHDCLKPAEDGNVVV